jgi:uncharacterized membrane protein YdfJ with MMPL/SSD domain
MTEVTVQLEPADYVAAKKLDALPSRRRALSIRFAFWYAVIGCALILAWAFTLEARLLAGVIFGVVIACILAFTVLPAVFRALYRRSFHRNSMQKPYRFSWSEQGFVVDSEDGQARANWSAVKRWKRERPIIPDLRFGLRLLYPAQAGVLR